MNEWIKQVQLMIPAIQGIVLSRDCSCGFRKELSMSLLVINFIHITQRTARCQGLVFILVSLVPVCLQSTTCVSEWWLGSTALVCDTKN